MARYAYKCNLCKLRHMFRKRLELYVRQKRCDRCGHTGFYWDSERNRRTFISRDDVCRCDAPYGHPHRRGSRFCRHNPNYELNLRTAAGESEIDVLIDMAWNGRGGTSSDLAEAPF